MHIGQNIAWLRDSKRMKQRDLAQMMGIKQQTLSKIERSENVSDKILENVAKALEMDPEFIRNFNPEKFINHINGPHNLVINYVVNYTVNGLDRSATEELMQSLHKLLDGK